MFDITTRCTRKFLVGIVLCLAVSIATGCAVPVAPRPDTVPPAWIDEPGEGAVGSATTHVKGRHYQEQLAIERAREKLAARLGVTVSSVQTVRETVRGGSASVVADRNTIQVIENKTVRARVADSWYDRVNDTFWVRVVAQD